MPRSLFSIFSRKLFCKIRRAGRQWNFWDFLRFPLQYGEIEDNKGRKSLRFLRKELAELFFLFSGFECLELEFREDGKGEGFFFSHFLISLQVGSRNTFFIFSAPHIIFRLTHLGGGGFVALPCKIENNEFIYV